MAVIFLAGAGGNGLAGSSPVSQELGRGMVSANYDRQTGERYATVRIRRLAQDYQRKGFFRIGVLPEVVGEGVSLECHNPARLATAFATLQNRLKDLARGASIELRDFEIYCPTERPLRLQARRVRVSGTECVLFDVALIGSPEGERRTSRATLVVDEDAGTLTLRTADDGVWKVVLSDHDSASGKSHSP